VDQNQSFYPSHLGQPPHLLPDAAKSIIAWKEPQENIRPIRWFSGMKVASQKKRRFSGCFRRYQDCSDVSIGAALPIHLENKRPLLISCKSGDMTRSNARVSIIAVCGKGCLLTTAVSSLHPARE
jgi:hypothetical protein